MQQILITGGTGTLGREIIKQLSGDSRQINVISTNENPFLPVNIKSFYGDLTDKESIYAAVNNADIIVHCASNPRNAKAIDFEGTKNLLTAVDAKKIKHIIYVSIAGVDKSDYPYYQIKYEIERMISGTDLPWTILRATQFHDLVLQRIIKPYDTGKDSTLTVPQGLRFQSIDTNDVARRINELVVTGPLKGVVTIGGPEVCTIEEMAQDYLNVLGRNERIKTEAIQTDQYNLFRSGVNLCPEHLYGNITWKQFLINSLNNDTL